MTLKDVPWPLDVWLKFDSPEDEEASYEANTYETEWGYQIKYYHSSVGLVRSVEFDTLDEVYEWYDANGFQDFTA